jgi:hypothetical protein
MASMIAAWVRWLARKGDHASDRLCRLQSQHFSDGIRKMKWMLILGSAAAIVGGLYRWRVAPSESDQWRAVDVVFVIVGIGGAAFFALGLVLLGTKQVFRLLG